MKKIKKLTALLLTLVMSLALAVPCFAAESQEGSRENAIHLMEGETVTVNGLTVTLEKVDEAEALSAARINKWYIRPTVTWTYNEMYGDQAICYATDGEMVGFDLTNRCKNPVTMEVWVNPFGGVSDYQNFYCSVGAGTYRLYVGFAFSGSNTADVQWSVDPSNNTTVDFTISAYQYWPD